MEENFKSKVLTNPLYFIAAGFGSGLLPFAPGTWGTLIAIPIYWFLSAYSLIIYLAVTSAAFALGVFVTDWVSRDMGEHDYGGIVWDEIVGYLITMILVPVSVTWIIVGFLLFRLFDIWKPQPIRYIDQTITGGLGIMLDDGLAAIYAWIVLQGLIWGLAGKF
ncbi:MAG: phosphatidylglycerophosphatase [Legionellales bacterium RIFCSPHIGHO2_12_FULL_42_9]|nr:MAG: phosphatidylglycerophosphatase [Legionellales bacterium RIFCSPHIGHO2_12_FULL_42_9]